MSRKQGTARDVFAARQMYFVRRMGVVAIARELGFSRKTIAGWIRPAQAERRRRDARRYHKRHRDDLALKRREREDRNRKDCRLCDGKMGRGSEGDVCMKCIKLERKFKWEYFAYLWNERVPVEEIARQMEWTVATTYNAVRRAREYGYQLDRRNLSAQLRSERTKRAAA